MGKLFIFIIFSCGAVLLSAQSGFNTGGGANFLGYARAGTTIDGIQSIYFNQAGLADINNFAADMSYERRFNLEDLNFISLALAKKIKLGTFGISAQHFGFEQFNEQKFGLAYARRLNSLITIGGQLNYLRYNVETLGSRQLLSFEVGTILKINRNFKLGTHIFSPGKIEVAEGTDLPSRFRVGLSYHPSSKVFLLVEADKAINRQTEYKMAIGYEILKAIHLRLGMNPVVSMYSIGFQASFNNKYNVAGAMGLNNSLGNTPAISLQYAD